MMKEYNVYKIATREWVDSFYARSIGEAKKIAKEQGYDEFYEVFEA